MAYPLLRPQPHLTFAELTNRYKLCGDARQQRYWHLIWLMAHPQEPKTVNQAAKLSGWSPNWARELVRRYNREGPKGFYDQRKNNEGQEAILTKKQQEKLKKAIMSGVAFDGGLWTGQKVAAWIAKEIGKTPPSETTGLNYLHKLGFTILMPRPQHASSASSEEVAVFKKSSAKALAS